ncbi:MAG: gliding motility lipoprotein GldB [Flavobacteriales bacterium]|nr:gliding motility lipoprotein GldB [Flavobacteriales bacterium]
MKYIVFFFSLVILSSCSNNKYVDVSDVNIDSELIRFDSLFYNVENIDGLTSLKKAYPLMFSEETNDTVWMNKVSDIEEQKVFQKSVTVFGDFNKQYSELVDLFKHVKYFYPEFNSPDVFTILSDFDYQYPVLYTQDRLFVSLDMYLGVDEEEYEMFPKYLVSNMVKERVKVDVADAISKNIISIDKYDRTLLSQMIYNGKLLYLSQEFIPVANEELLIGYTKEQLDWCSNNESDIWAYMVKNKLIYSSDERLLQRFITVAPFTKFYLELDQQSPGRVGVWLGWQIVKSYMDNNDVSLSELMSNKDAKGIFKKSRYKPSK